MTGVRAGVKGARVGVMAERGVRGERAGMRVQGVQFVKGA